MHEQAFPLLAAFGGDLAGYAAAVVALGVLVFIHEFGHFLVAKALGVGVVKFSLGFGPTIVGRKIGETEYVLSWIPLGGYVKMIGETPGEWMNEETEIPSDMDPARSFSRRSPWVRLAIAAAGPVFNLLLAFVAYWCVFAFQGQIVDSDASSTVIGEVTLGGPAYDVGLKKGDEVVAVSGTRIQGWDELREAVQATGGEPFQVSVRRGADVLDFGLSAMERPGAEEPSYMIGIMGLVEYEPVPPLEAAALAARVTGTASIMIPQALGAIVTGQVSARQIQGPIGIARAAGRQFEQGIFSYLELVALLSVNLGVLNLLPIPVLDGGMLLLCLLEVVRRKPLTAHNLALMQQAGFVFLLCVMALALFNDVYNISPFGRAHVAEPTSSTFQVDLD